MVAVGAMLVFPTVSDARPQICSKLLRQLASIESVSFNPNASKFQRAAGAQAGQLQIAKGQARQAGCGGSILFFGGENANSGYCSKINGTIRRMESNLAKLQSKSNSQVSPRANRGRLLAALDANNCNGQIIKSNVTANKLPPPLSDNTKTLFQQLFGSDDSDEAPAPQMASKLRPIRAQTVENNGDSQILSLGGPSGSYRTLCVRTCDGYYFPVSYSTTSSHFPVDEKACSAMCPATVTKLYYHSVPDQEPEQMISLAREPYSSSPNAFQYRINGVRGTPGCSCHAAPSVDETALEAFDSKVNMTRWIPLPSIKPSLLDDEETRLNRSAKLDGGAIANLIDAKTSNQTLAAQGKIRVVGPAFLPVQSTAKDLQVPGRVSVQ